MTVGSSVVARVGEAALEQVPRSRWQGDGALAGIGSRNVLDDQAAISLTDDGAGNGQRGGCEVDGRG